MAVNVNYNGSALTSYDGTHGILVQNIEHAGKNTKQAQTYALAHGNKSAIPFVEYPAKPITISGVIIGTSIADCDAQIDTFNSLLTAKDANLDFDYNGGSLNRRYVATATNISVTRPGNLAWADFAVTFTSTQPFGQDTGTTTLLNATGRTSGSYSDSVTLAGTFPFQLPTITLTYTAIGSSPVSNGLVSVGNDSTGQTLNVQRTWTTGDILVIDCSLSTTTPVTVNSGAVDFIGAFPDFSVGVGAIDYNDNFTTRTFNYNIVYYKY